MLHITYITNKYTNQLSFIETEYTLKISARCLLQFVRYLNSNIEKIHMSRQVEITTKSSINLISESFLAFMAWKFHELLIFAYTRML